MNVIINTLEFCMLIIASLSYHIIVLMCVKRLSLTFTVLINTYYTMRSINRCTHE